MFRPKETGHEEAEVHPVVQAEGRVGGDAQRRNRSLALQLVVDRLCIEFPYYSTRHVSLYLRRGRYAVDHDLARSLMTAVNWRRAHPGPRIPDCPCKEVDLK